MQPIDFYQGHLDRVSRSFAFCIRRLEPPFRQWISLSYLLCRVLDTIEDAPWTHFELQEEQYAAFSSFLIHPPSLAESLRWSLKFPEAIPPSEKALLRDSVMLFEDLRQLPEDARNLIQASVGKMARGMLRYSRRERAGGLRLEEITDVNRYCYFVAGVVGELLSRLFSVYRPDFRADREFHKNALHFGLFLQKINLLKDQSVDQREGRYLVPDRTALLGSLRQNAQGAVRYLIQLPIDEKGFRVFCAWSLFLGAASLPWIEQAHAGQDGTRIPRSVTQELLTAIEAIVQDNEALMSGLEEYLKLLPPEPRPSPLQRHDSRVGREANGEMPPASPARDASGWFRSLSEWNLGDKALVELGMM